MATWIKGLGSRDAEDALWACYQRGLYASVSSAKPQGALGSRWYFAKTVAAAACGHETAARRYLSLFLKVPGANVYRADLIQALAGYLPRVALGLLDWKTYLPHGWRVALLLRTGQVEQARQYLSALPAKAFDTSPELALLKANAFGGAPADLLRVVNGFLGWYGLPGVRLRDAAHAPSPLNMVAAGAPGVVDGPLVSVLMTTFRTGARAVAAVRSVLAQRYRNFELIVLDDASDDGTPELLRDLAREDARIRFVPLPRNVGTYAAKLIGLGLARGEFVTCHDSDDWAHPDKLLRQVAPLMEDTRLVATVSYWVRMSDEGLFYARQVYPLMRMNLSSLLFRRERVLREAGAWDSVRTGADSEFWARLRLVFGDDACERVRLPLSLGSHRSDSLMTGQITGYAQDTGVSPFRIAYGEAWARWHDTAIAAGGKPFLPAQVQAALTARPFPVADEQGVSAEDVASCLRELGFAPSGPGHVDLHPSAGMSQLAKPREPSKLLAHSSPA